MSSSFTTRRASLALIAPLLTVGFVATAAPASAVPMEGTSSSGCIRLVDVDGDRTPGSPLFVSFGYALFLDC